MSGFGRVPQGRRRNVVTTAIAATACVAVTAACGGGSGSDGDTTLTMWTFLDPAGTDGREQVLGDLIESFEDDNPGVTVEVQVQQWDSLTTQFLAADASGAAPDVVWVVVDQFANVAQQGALADLNELAFGEFSDDELADVQDVYWEGMTTDDGAMYGVVHSRNYFGVAYRADLLAEAGVDPESIETWDDLVAAGEELTDPAQSRWGIGQAFATAFADPQILATRILEEQGELFDANGSPMWANDAGVSAMEFQAALVEEHGVTSSDAVRLTAEDLWELFASGQVAMISGASVRIPGMQDQLGAENVGFMHYPSQDGNGHAPGALAGWAVGVWDGSEDKEVAADFVAHLSSAEADGKWLTEAQQPPIYASTAEQHEDFLSQPENDFLATVAEGAQEYGWLPPMDVPTGGWREALNTGVQGVVLEGTPPLEALENAERQFDSGTEE